MRYAVVIEKAADNYSAYVPDLPGCIATGETTAEVERELREAIRLHSKGLEEDGSSRPAAERGRRIWRDVSRSRACLG